MDGPNFKTGSVPRHKTRHGTLLQLPKYQKYTGELRTAYPFLIAVQNKRITLGTMSELGYQGLKGTSSTGFRQGKGPDRFPFGQGRKPSSFLLLRSPLQEGHGNHGLDRQHACQRGRAPPQSFIQQTERDDVPSLPSVFFRQTAAQTAGLRQHGYHGIGNSLLPVPFVGERFDVQGHKVLELRVLGFLFVSQQMLHKNRVLLTTTPPVLSHHKRGSRVKGLEILDVQIVHSDFDGKGLFDKRHQLDGKQGVDDTRFEKIVVIAQMRDVDRAQYEALDGFLDPVLSRIR